MPLILSGDNGVQGNSGALVSGTAVTASGTSVDFTGIPSWAKRITVMLFGVSTSGTSLPMLQLGQSSGFQTSGYSGRTFDAGAVNNSAYSTGFTLSSDNSAASIYYGSIILTLSHATFWLQTGLLSRSDGANQYKSAGGLILTTGPLDRIRITTVNGTDVFDAGTINIMYE